jgi:hypothetical protein
MDDIWKGLTALIAVALAYTAYQQYRIARERFKLELFEKRFSVFAATRTLLSHVLTNANVSMEQFFEFRRAVAEATFLFEADITNYLSEIDKKALYLHTTHELMSQRPPAENRQKIVEEHHQLLKWLTDQLPELKPKFAPYLKFRAWN